MSDYIDFSNKSSAVLIDFRYGDLDRPRYLNLCNLQEDIMIDGNLYLGLPNIDIELAPNSGGLDSKGTKIEMPVTTGRAKIDAFLTLISPRYPAPRVKVYVREVFFTTDLPLGVDKYYYLYSGYLKKRRENPNGKPGIIQLEFEDVKKRLNTAVGPKSDQTCWSIFGGTPCNKEIRQIFPLLTGAGPKAMEVFMNQAYGRSFRVILSPTWYGTMTGPGAEYMNFLKGIHATQLPHGAGTRWWMNGFFEYQGLRLTVKEWIWNTNTFIFYKQPPAYLHNPGFTNKEMKGILYPGCDGLIDSCRRWNNESQFAGVGYSTPAYDPRFQAGDK